MLTVLDSVILLGGVLVSVAMFTVVERKGLSGMQLRSGPNLLGWYGILQAVGDGVKLILKAFTLPEGSERLLFVIGPLVSFVTGVGVWGLLPQGEATLGEVGVSLIVVLALSSVGIHGVLLGGYASNSKYAYYGGVRSGGQMISYEVSLAFLLGSLILLEGGSFSLASFGVGSSGWLLLGSWPLFLLWLVSILAETNRHPFDLPEAESELVSGYNVEYSGGSFALYFLGEYSSILFMSLLTAYLYAEGSVVLFLAVVVFFVWARGGWPRVRYDQLMTLGWRSILPLSVSILLLSVGIVV